MPDREEVSPLGWMAVELPALPPSVALKVIKFAQRALAEWEKEQSDGG